MTVIQLNNISKQFQVPLEKQTTLKEFLLQLHRRKPTRTLHALKDISININQGEILGIIGANGSGKSTLLKILAGVYTPTSGTYNVKGSISPLLELGIGFNDEMSARDNVFLNATILGMSKDHIHNLYPAIVEFSGLQDFMEMKIKNFSSGMRMRLAFSIASQVQADIYLCDEVLAVGDAEIQQKCLQTFDNLKNAAKTIILVTHDTNTAQEFCDRLILIEQGTIKAEGSPEEVVNVYQ